MQRQKFFLLIIVLVSLLIVNSASQAKEVLNIVEFDPLEQWSEANVRPIGEASASKSQIFEGGLALAADFGENMVAVPFIVTGEKRAATIRVTIEEMAGKGNLTMVNITESKGKGDQVIGVIFELEGNNRTILPEISPAWQFLNSYDELEMHFWVENGQSLDIGSITVEFLKEKIRPIRPVYRYRYFPPSRTQTVFHYIYRGPIYYTYGSYVRVYYDWWNAPSFTLWCNIARPRIVRIYPQYRAHYCYAMPIHERQRYVVASSSRPRRNHTYNGQPSTVYSARGAETYRGGSALPLNRTETTNRRSRQVGTTNVAPRNAVVQKNGNGKNRAAQTRSGNIVRSRSPQREGAQPVVRAVPRDATSSASRARSQRLADSASAGANTSDSRSGSAWLERKFRSAASYVNGSRPAVRNSNQSNNSTTRSNPVIVQRAPTTRSYSRSPGNTSGDSAVVRQKTRVVRKNVVRNSPKKDDDSDSRRQSQRYNSRSRLAVRKDSSAKSRKVRQK